MENGKTLIAHSDNEFLFWNFGTFDKKLKFEGKDLSNSTLQVSPRKSHLFLKPHWKSLLYKINLKNHMLIEKRVELPEYIWLFKFFNEGDAIIYYRYEGKIKYRKE